MKKKYITAALVVSLDAAANGFAIPEQNITNLGTAYAGTASLAVDASTAFYNPAGLIRLKNEQVVAGMVVADSNTFLNVNSATYNMAPNLATPNSGTDKPEARAYIPSLHYAKKMDDKFTFGASLVSTFGSKNNYNYAAVSRYMATESSMQTINLAPGFGYKYSDMLAFGAGLDIYHGRVVLNSAFGTTGVAVQDGFSRHKGTGNQVGVHAGMLYSFNPETRVGIKYNSRVLIKFRGEQNLQLAAGAPVTTKDIESKIDLPESITFSGYHDLTDKIAVMGDVQWLHWSRLKNVVIDYADGTSATLGYHYKNSYRLAVGGTYQYNNKLQLKLGTSFDSTPASDLWRSTAVPDGNQTSVAVGMRYNLSKKIIVDAGLAHIFSNTVAINQQPAVGFNSLTATSKSHINAAGIQFTFNMGT